MPRTTATAGFMAAVSTQGDAPPAHAAATPAGECCDGVRALHDLLRAWGGSAAANVACAAPAEDGAGALAPALSLPQELADRAVSLAFLQEFYDVCVAPLPDGAAMTTDAVVTQLIIPATETLGRCSVARVAPSAFGPPHAFVSHAFRNPLSLLLAALREYFRDAVASEVFLWLDIFAINQHAPGADLHDGETLALTIASARAVLVVLDKHTAPLSRLWCLFEIDSTPPDKLLMLTPGYTDTDLSAAFAAICVDDADCFDPVAKKMIQAKIRERHGGSSAFQAALRLRLLLRPTSHADDMTALLAHANSDTWRFEELHTFLLMNLQRVAGAGADDSAPAVLADAEQAPRLACIAGGAGEGKSTLAAALCGRHGTAVHAYHFCKASDVRRQDVGAVIRSLAFQLALSLRGVFAARLLALTPAQIASLTASPDATWELLLEEPLAALPPGTPVVLLFDALDEAHVGADSTPPTAAVEAAVVISPMMKLLLRLGRLPPGGASLRVAVTCRTEEEVHVIAPLRGCFSSHFRLFKPGTLRKAVTAPLHAAFSPQSNAVAGNMSPLLLALNAALSSAHPHRRMPVAATLDAAYNAWFDASFDAADVARTAELLSVLVAARQPPSVAQLAAMGHRVALKSLPGWDTLFFEREHKVHLKHRSLEEWLTNARDGGGARFGAQPVAGHAVWAAQLWDAQLAPWLFCTAGAAAAEAPPQGSYVYAHALAHLDAAVRPGDTTRVLLSLRWLQATLRERGLAALLSDLGSRRLTHGDAVAILHSTLRLAAPGLQGADAPACLPAQLVGRIRGAALEGDGAGMPLLRALIAEACAWRGVEPWLRAVSDTLHAAGVLEAIIAVGDNVQFITPLSADRIIVAFAKKPQLEVWSVVTGELELILSGHTGTWDFIYETAPVADIAVLPGGSKIISEGRDRTLRLWNATTGECEHVASGHIAGFLPDGQVLCKLVDSKPEHLHGSSASYAPFTWDMHTGEKRRVGAQYPEEVIQRLLVRGHLTLDEQLVVQMTDSRNDTELRVMKLPSCELLRTISVTITLCREDGKEGPRCFAVLRLDGDDVAACGFNDSQVRLYSLTTGLLVRELAGHTGAVIVVRPLPDGRLMTGGAMHDHSVRLWDLELGVCVLVLECHTVEVNCISVLPDGRVVTGARDGTVCILNTCAYRSQQMQHAARHTQDVTCIATLPDGSHVVTGSKDSTLCVWSMADGCCTRKLRGHTDAVTCVAALMDGRFVSGSLDDSMRLWAAHAVDGACDATLAVSVYCVCALPDGRFVSGSGDGTLRIWSAEKQPTCQHSFIWYDKPSPSSGRTSPRRRSIHAVANLPGNRVVVCESDVCVWNYESSTLERTLELSGESRLRNLLPSAKMLYELGNCTALRWNVAAGDWGALLLAASAPDTPLGDAAFMEAYAALAHPVPLGMDHCMLDACVQRMHMDLPVREVVVSVDGQYVAVVTQGSTVHFFELMPSAA